jgi:phosphomannomutase
VTVDAAMPEDAARAWLAEDPDPETREELADILDRGDFAALTDRFGAHLTFGTAGLRGELGAGPNRMNRVVVMRAAGGLAAYLRARDGASVVVGYDARRNSDRFARDTAAVLTGAGLRALLLPRPLPTPVLAHAIRHLGCDAGVMVTASHNPPQDNGYKVYLADGAQIAPPADVEIAAKIAAVGPLVTIPLGDEGEVLGVEVVTAYLDALADLPLGTDRDVCVAYTPLHGVARDVVLAAFERASFPAPVVAAEQGEPDPAFPTVAFPNPEEPGAMDLALALGRRIGADVVLANDPDGDRCAVAAGGRLLTGDEVGALLAERVLANTSGPDRLVATTIVSSSLLSRIADAHGVRYAETLTGFKWIVRAGDDDAQSRFVYGYEEALGYCLGGPDGVPVRDKDGISAALVVAGLAASLKADGRTLLDALDDLARQHGVYATAQLSVRVDDLAEIAALMQRLRSAPPTKLGGQPVTSVEDLSAGAAGLPPTEGLRYRLGGGGRVVVRPSGTEPKLKAYLEVVVPVGDDVVAAARIAAATALAAIRTDLAAALTQIASG